MSRVIRRRWASDLTAPSRQGRLGCEYGAYVPDPLGPREISLDGPVAAEVAAAESALSRLNTKAAALVNTEALARILLRAESVASSKIEGLEIGARRLLRAEAVRDLGDVGSDVTAVEVLGNIDAMVHGVGAVTEGGAISLELLLEIHRRLLTAARPAAQPGRLRLVQNWIGGSDFNPCAAAFVPPPPELVPELMNDLVAFCNQDTLPAIAQAAMAHAQFETIHPFVDGNGRTGRALIHLVLRRRGASPRVLPPVSLVLATSAAEYVAHLTATRYLGPASSRAAHVARNRWISSFAEACGRAVNDAALFERRTREIEAGWRQRLVRVRANSAVDQLLRALLGAPVVTVGSAAALIGRSFVQTNEAVTRLVEAGILRQVSVGRRNRAFEAPALIGAFADLERRLASPTGDTRTAEPAWRVPRRRGP